MRAAAVAVLLAVVLRLALGPGSIGYDAAWSLEWARETLSGSLPDFDAAGAPTPHPLANLAALVLAPLGTHAAWSVMALTWLAVGALAVVCFRLGERLFSPWVGVAFAALLVTRGLLVRETQQAIVDVPFLALVVAALAVEASSPRRGLRVPVLLFLAGLLRPEAWLLGAAWIAWAAPAQPRRATLKAAAVITAAPALWALQDVIVTGDALHSLHGTQELAAELGRPRAAGTAVATAPRYLRFALGDAAFWLGLAGAAAGIVWRPERSRLPAAVLFLGLAGFLVLGVAGLPLLIRYLLLPAAMLALFAAVAALGWTAWPGSRVWTAAGVAACMVLLVSIPSQAGRLGHLRDITAPRTDVQEDLAGLAAQPAVRAAVARCGALYVPDARPRPLLAFALHRDPGTLPTLRGATTRGAYLVYATDAAAAVFSIGPPAPPGEVPPGARLVARNRSWVLAERC